MMWSFKSPRTPIHRPILATKRSGELCFILDSISLKFYNLGFGD
ncbi:Hypothetical protein BN2458_PEG0264 [Helicobacter typhlonius]|uniref:Uncharacterized protein n=1 Tax=Helicobacter typhlonius TaxID=76936 RepID=A0A0S4PS73_9HELI|nr:Hypothetical protein BN2458_PEG0264 [Helicobacter typhlonius]